MLAAAGCGVAGWWGVEHPKPGLIVAMALVSSVPFVVRGLQRRWDPFEPINLIALGMLFMFVARPILELKEHTQAYAPLYNAPAGFIPAMIVGIVGTATLYAAYFTNIGSSLASRMKSLPSDWDSARSVRFTIWLVIFGFLITVPFAAKLGLHGYIQLYMGRKVGQLGVLRSTDGYFRLGVYVVIPGSLIALTAWRRSRSLASGLVFLFCITVALLITVPRGDRTYEVALILPLIVLFYLHRRRRPRVWAILAAFVAFTMAANISTALRHQETRAQRGVSKTIVYAVTHPGHELAAFVRGADGSEFSVLEIEMHEYQLHVLPHWPGSTFVSLGSGWIPHSVLKNKPLSPLQHITWTLFPKTYGGGSFLPPVYGSFYVDSGWISVLLLSALVGIALRTYWEYLRRHPDNFGVQLFYAATLPLVAALQRADLSLVFGLAVFLSLPLIYCIIRCSREPLKLWPRRRPARPAVVHG
jgi:hypothetical protein